MKTARFFLAAGALVASAAFLSAGPGPQYWAERNADAKAKAAAQNAANATVTPAPTAANTTATAPNCATCACCKKAS